jgi:hypothetical protein
MKRWAALVGGLGLMAAACQSDPAAWQAGSQPVDKSVIATFAGPKHCGMQDSTLLVVGWPLGHPEPNVSAARWYVRNPAAFEQQELLAEFGASVTPPKDARNTGYHNSTFELWLAPSDQDAAAYIKTAGHFELWPRARHSLDCM